MSSVVALGDEVLRELVARAHAGTVDTIWVHGAEIGYDGRFSRLEDVLDPLMDAYFSDESSWRIGACSRAIHAEPELDGIVGAATIAAAAERVLLRDLRQCLALVEMLDRAHARYPVDEVVVGTDDVLPRAAVAWAKANGVPTVLVADAPSLTGAAQPMTDRVITFGERARDAYAAIGVHAPRITILPSARYELTAELHPDPSRYRAALASTRGFGREDYFVAFEPGARAFDITAPDVTPFASSLREMFAAFIDVKRSVPAARLLIVPGTFPARLMESARALAAEFALGDDTCVFIERDRDAWLSIADVLVGAQSLTAFEVALRKTPAIDVWHADRWYGGPAFGAEDGIIDTVPGTLASTVVALAHNPAVAGEIAAIVRERAAGFGLSPGTAAASTLAAEIARGRRPAAPAVVVARKPDIIVYAPNYAHASAGVRALYRLCHFINVLSGEATIFPAERVHPTWNTPQRQRPLTERTIVIYPETAVKELPAKRNVRWVLNTPGLLAGPARYDDDDMVFYHTGFLEAAARATSEKLTPERELAVGTIEPELFYNDESRPKLYDCIYVGKGQERYDRMRLPELDRALVIRGGSDPWPATRLDMAKLLRGCRNLYMYDEHSAIVEEARLCGAYPYVVAADGRIAPYPGEHLPLEYARLNLTAYFDYAHVERFLRLVTQRWR